MHRSPVLGTAPARMRGASKRRWLARIDDVEDDGAGREHLRIDRHGIVHFHAKRRGIDDDVEALRVRRPRTYVAAGFSSNGCRKVASPMCVDIGYGQLASACGRDRKRDGAPCASGADEKHGLIRRVVAFPLHPKNATNAIKYRADPTSIRLATDDVERADLTSRWI